MTGDGKQVQCVGNLKERENGKRVPGKDQRN